MDQSFICSSGQCGRKFNSEDELINHMQRRHGQEQKWLTKQFVQDITGLDDFEDITELILRRMDIERFEANDEVQFEDFISLELLSLAHNKIQDITAIGQFYTLIELNINNNLVQDLQPLANLIQLRTLWANKNQIDQLSSLVNCKNLQILGLSNNLIKDLHSVLMVISGLNQLNVLEIEKNPCYNNQEILDFEREIAKQLFEPISAPQDDERDALIYQLKQLKKQHRKLKKQHQKLNNNFIDKYVLQIEEDLNKQLKREVNSMYELLEEIDYYQEMLLEDQTPGSRRIFNENIRLQQRIIELESKLHQKSQSKRPMSAYSAYTQRQLSTRPQTAKNTEFDLDEDISALLQSNMERLAEIRKGLDSLKQYPNS